MGADTNRKDAGTLLDELLALRAQVESESAGLLDSWGARTSGEPLPGVANMARYVALRRNDLRPLQRDLAPLGLSSLGRLEGHVVESLDAVTQALSVLAGRIPPQALHLSSGEAFLAGEALLRDRARQLFGIAPQGADVSVMVTLDPVLTGTPEGIAALVRNGASVFRLNSAHDGIEDWGNMVQAVRQVERDLETPLRILMDLAGPKVRTAKVIYENNSRRVHRGDDLMLLDRAELANPADGPFQFTTTVPGLPGLLTAGAHVLIDDGRLDAVVEWADSERAALRAVRARPKGERLRPDKGLNVPGVLLPIDALTAKDLVDLEFAVASVDMVGLSFVRQASDIALLQRHIDRLGGSEKGVGVVAKVESPAAFSALPEIIVQGLHTPFAVMIARGDLAVEAGFERLAEVQEEMLWLCESAHVPVIWATQVLESLSHDATYSRAEVTDAAMGARAECVMLNKGEHLPEAVATLTDLLKRMSGHQRKKSAQLRALAAW